MTVWEAAELALTHDLQMKKVPYLNIQNVHTCVFELIFFSFSPWKSARKLTPVLLGFFRPQVSTAFPACSGRRRSGWRSRLRPTSSTACTRASTRASRSSLACRSNGRACCRTRPTGLSPWWTPPTSPPSSWLPWRWEWEQTAAPASFRLNHDPSLRSLAHVSFPHSLICSSEKLTTSHFCSFFSRYHSPSPSLVYKCVNASRPKFLFCRLLCRLFCFTPLLLSSPHAKQVVSPDTSPSVASSHFIRVRDVPKILTSFYRPIIFTQDVKKQISCPWMSYVSGCAVHWPRKVILCLGAFSCTVSQLWHSKPSWRTVSLGCT